MSKVRRPQRDDAVAGYPDAGAARSYVGLPAVAGDVLGAPVLAYGRTFVYGVSPDFDKDVVLQESNTTQQRKLKPKKSWESAENWQGSMVSWQPRTPQNDHQPFLAINLIDGDAATSWCSRGAGQPNVEPAWVRIDLAREETLSELVLVPQASGQGIPGSLTIKVSRDSWHWTTIYEGASVNPSASGGSLRFPIPRATPVKQIWIIGDDLPLVELGLMEPGPYDLVNAEHCFILAEIQALDEHGDNVALASRGAGVTVSSTNYGQGSTWDVYDLLWPTQYDLGVKWVRLSGSNPPYHHDTLQWRFVEQMKGQYVIDEKTDQAITEATSNGLNVIVILCYGNWLYTTAPHNESLDPRLFPRPFAPAPVSREAFDGFKEWVRFMVHHFKGRVAYWEIFNEADAFGWEVIQDYQERVKVYCDLVKEVVPIIRDVDPTARVSLAGMAGVPGLSKSPWLDMCLEQDVVQLVDAIGWHTQSTVVPERPENWIGYPRAIREFQERAELKGFRGAWMASEAWWGAPYPPHTQWGHPPHTPIPGKRVTEIRKAKDMARMFVMNAGLGVVSFWCNTWFDQTQNDCGLFRNTFAADPVSPTQPQAAYYVLRTLCAVLDGAEPAELNVTGSAGSADEIQTFTFTLPDHAVMVAAWLPGESVDRHQGSSASITVVLPTQCEKVVGVDSLNGVEQDLQFEQHGDLVTIPRILLRDYPTFIKIQHA